jgi:hypothetical protein
VAVDEELAFPLKGVAAAKALEVVLVKDTAQRVKGLLRTENMSVWENIPRMSDKFEWLKLLASGCSRYNFRVN